MNLKQEAEECKRDIVEMLEFGCPFKSDSIGEKDATMAEVVMQLGAEEIIKLRNRITSLETALAGRTRELDEALKRVAELETDKAKYIHNSIAVNCNRCEETHIKLQADARQLAEAVIESHEEYRFVNFRGRTQPCDCPACQTARRVMETQV